MSKRTHSDPLVQSDHHTTEDDRLMRDNFWPMLGVTAIVMVAVLAVLYGLL